MSMPSSIATAKSIGENAVNGKYKNGGFFNGRSCEIQVDNYTIDENGNSFASGSF
jgi:hypothetical protein